jgi:predicted TPR repeat methyltransferase/Tfp pilus assembly protein PilF
VNRAAGRELTLPQAIELAGDLIRADELDEAEHLLGAVLARLPEQPDALHFLGMLRHAQGDTAGGIALIQQAISAMPTAWGAWNNLGNLLLQQRRFDEAAAAYARSIALGETPAQRAPAWNNLGTLHRKCRRLREAEAACRTAIDLVPDFADAWYNLSRILIEDGRVAEGLAANSRAVVLWPREVQARDQVIRALVLLGELEPAAALYRDWLREDPDNPVIQHQLAACLQADAEAKTPARASDAYVEKVFDSFASSFDTKLASLQYQAPALVAEALREALPAAARQFDVVDVGCGTGLVGPLVRDWARRLAGCDLSVEMLRKARSRGIYDVLHKAELVYYLQTQPAAFDVAVSADTLCYFGDLGDAVRAARRALRAGGTLVFTVEALPDDTPRPFRLQPNGRYAHTLAHVGDALQAAGLLRLQARRVALRQEGGRPVSGWLVSAQAP